MFAQLLLNSPVQAVRGDPLILRDQSAQRTLGGGRVLDPFAPTRQRRSPERLAQLQALANSPDLEEVLPALLAHSDSGLDPQRLERQFNRPRSTWTLPDGVRLIDTRQGALLYSAERWEAQKTPVLEHLARFHQLEPDQMGPDRDRLRRFSGGVLERATFISLLDEMLASGAIASSGPWLHLPGHQVRLSEEDEALWQQLQPLFEAGGFDPPWVRNVGQDEATVRALLRKMARLGLLHQVVRDLFYPDSVIRRLAAMLVQLADADPVITVAAFRDAVGLGRKRSIQILEYFDRIGLTRRFGDRRQIRPDNALAQRSPED
jgi:selenocysteine-specific elongation factor